ncbi:hypothetical protein DY000_02023626 [Brassica cretica]|uniref:Uncharacterized protein n=1 Tax=Brassica cretica TaxID=69181 RepID=A0ABQ7EHQ4_BRACR|nr:hypothetical protein DY000_02023626 [Brassica cretica]
MTMATEPPLDSNGERWRERIGCWWKGSGVRFGGVRRWGNQSYGGIGGEESD